MNCLQYCVLEYEVFSLSREFSLILKNNQFTFLQYIYQTEALLLWTSLEILGCAKCILKPQDINQKYYLQANHINMS